MKTLTKTTPTELRKSIKRKKSTLAEEVLSVLTNGEEITARDIVSRLFNKLVVNHNSYPEIMKKRMIVDLSKDFNTKLAERLETIGVKREKNEEGVFVYSLK